MHGSNVFVNETRRGKKTTLCYDLIFLDKDIKKEVGNKIMEEYRNYLKTFPMGRNATTTFGGFKTVMLITVANEDVDFWKEKIVSLISDVNNLVQV